MNKPTASLSDQSATLLDELLTEYLRARQHGIDVQLAHAYEAGITDIVAVADPEDDEIVKRVRAHMAASGNKETPDA